MPDAKGMTPDMLLLLTTSGLLLQPQTESAVADKKDLTLHGDIDRRTSLLINFEIYGRMFRAVSHRGTSQMVGSRQAAVHR